MGNNLTKEDMDFIKKLLLIDKKILELYKSLAMLEYKKRFGTDEFNDTVANLDKLLTIEKSIYNIENLSFDRINSIVLYLRELDKKSYVNNDENICYGRMINNLEDILLKKDKNSVGFLESILFNDLHKNTIILFNNYIYDSKYLKYKKEMILRKYLYYFVDTNMEQDNIKSNFVVDKELTSTFDLVTEFMNISPEMTNIIKIGQIGEAFLYDVSNIMALKKIISYDDSIYSKLLYLKCSCKSGLILLPDMVMQEAEESLFKGKFNSEELDFFKELFEETHEDKKRMLKVSFNRNRD